MLSHYSSAPRMAALFKANPTKKSSAIAGVLRTASTSDSAACPQDALRELPPGFETTRLSARHIERANLGSLAATLFDEGVAAAVLKYVVRKGRISVKLKATKLIAQSSDYYPARTCEVLGLKVAQMQVSGGRSHSRLSTVAAVLVEQARMHLANSPDGRGVIRINTPSCVIQQYCDDVGRAKRVSNRRRSFRPGTPLPASQAWQ